MKKLMIALTIVVASVGISRPSQAMVGGFIGNFVLIGVGGVMSISCALQKGLCRVYPESVNYVARKIGSLELTSEQYSATMLVQFLQAAIMLNTETASTSFIMLSEEKAESLGITQSERESFNSEIELVNAVLNEASLAGGVYESSQVWLSAQSYLATNTMLAISKVGDAMRAELF